MNADEKKSNNQINKMHAEHEKYINKMNARREKYTNKCRDKKKQRVWKKCIAWLTERL